jgi:FMN-dependent NADH-azoreductase
MVRLAELDGPPLASFASFAVPLLSRLTPNDRFAPVAPAATLRRGHAGLLPGRAGLACRPRPERPGRTDKGKTMNILHIDSSALGQHSVSRQLTAEIVAGLRAGQPGASLRHHDLAAEPLPHWSPVADAADPAVARSVELLEEFLAADVLVIGAPMYNFGIPSTLKAWIDRIAVAGKTFRYGPNGPEGLAGGKRVIVVSTRGGIYSEGAAAAMDHQESYLRTVFGFLGISEVEFVRAEGLNMGEAARSKALSDARASIDGGQARAA